jgi:anti-sigma-K factor RskA
MTRLTDEMLMAYADGALAEAERAEIAAALENDAEAQAIVAEFRRTADLSRAAFADVLTEPVPDRLVNTVLGTPTLTTNIVDLARGRKPRSTMWRTALPLAASVLLVIGVATVLLLRPQPAGPLMVLGPVPSAAPLADVLETKASGVAVTLASRTAEGLDRLMVVATFRDRKARICREIEALDPNMQPQIAGVACRDPANGTWIVEGSARIASTAPAGGRDFTPSGADEKDALDGLLAVLGATRALPADEEQGLLARGWK